MVFFPPVEMEIKHNITNNGKLNEGNQVWRGNLTRQVWQGLGGQYWVCGKESILPSAGIVFWVGSMCLIPVARLVCSRKGGWLRVGGRGEDKGQGNDETRVVSRRQLI